ncbi:hypothetical protein [Myxococcus qinghaiensis]|uniref:hypothetical protein n=1 Tax=Myxococcus qinghaiensis TaxID=2906758 RepID=UPI0020A6F81A|nr:hypothetical protein [Myxococcus qinghaiensis]MCP3168043.1 hypothetical protein [Myxococcus qinghaiensis]
MGQVTLRGQRLKAVMLLCVLLTSFWARAEQRVAVLDFTGDRRDAVRKQLERSLQAKGSDVIKGKLYATHARRLGLRGREAHTDAAIATLSRELKLAAIVRGAVSGRALTVEVVSASGRLLGTDSYPLKQGRLSKKDAFRAASTILTTLRGAATEVVPHESVEPAEPVASMPQDVAPLPPAKADARASSGVAPPKPTTTADARVSSGVAPSKPTATVEVAAAPAEDMAPVKTPAPVMGPRWVSVRLGGATTFRSYCAAPGITSCGQLESQPQTERPERSLLFGTPSPYSGFSAGLDVFPLALLGDTALEGLGVTAELSRRWPQVRIQGGGPGGTASAVDMYWSLFGTYRLYFPLSFTATPLPAFVGLRAGGLSHSFKVAEEYQALFPKTGRTHASVGLDVSVTLARLARVEAGFLYFIRPQPGREQQDRYGPEVSSSGFGLEAGVGGELVGPLEYSVRYRFQKYADTFSGAGTEWTGGGISQERYSGLNWTLGASF